LLQRQVEKNNPKETKKFNENLAVLLNNTQTTLEMRQGIRNHTQFFAGELKQSPVTTTKIQNIDTFAPKQKLPVNKILAEAEKAFPQKIQFPPVQNTTKHVDTLLTDMVKHFNKISKTRNIKLYNGITGKVLVDSRNHTDVYIRLGHKLVPLKNATIHKQLNVKKKPPSNSMKNRIKQTVKNKKEKVSIEETAAAEQAIKDRIEYNKKPIVMIAYSIGLVLHYHIKSKKRNKSNNNNTNQAYLYQGVIPEPYREPGETLCYVLSEYPPTIQEDKISIQKASRSSINSAEPMQKVVLKRVFPRYRWKTPRFLKNASAQDVGVVTAGIGMGTVGLSTLALIL
jgi:hypothetical protein